MMTISLWEAAKALLILGFVLWLLLPISVGMCIRMGRRAYLSNDFQKECLNQGEAHNG